MKQTWKLHAGMVVEAEAALRTAPSFRAAAKQLGLSHSTLSRAIQQGRLSVAPRALKRAAAAPPAEHGSFLAWVTATFELSPGELELAKQAQMALTFAGDANLSASVRLQAAASYRALLKDLRLPLDVVMDGPRPGRRDPATEAVWRD